MLEPAIGVVLVIVSITVCIAVLAVLRRFLDRKGQQPVPGAAGGIEERLERIQMTVEATAIEVERIAEANRFMSRLLAERPGTLSPASSPERVTTPR